jgi:putative addiction module killer protein
MMFTVKRTPDFDAWFAGIRVDVARQRLGAGSRKAQLGSLGDIKSVGAGVFEMRENFGPGWRLYYLKHGKVLIVMLGGGNKSTQTADIAKAVRLAARIEE